MDHVNGIHDARQALDDGGRIVAVQRLAEFLQRVQVLDIVPGLIGGVRYAAVEIAPYLGVWYCGE